MQFIFLYDLWIIGFEETTSNMLIYFRRSDQEASLTPVYVRGESGETDVFTDEEVWLTATRNSESQTV